jgi:hypothetical protein
MKNKRTREEAMKAEQTARALRQTKIERAALVYQGGIANVFAVEAFNIADYGRDARRLLQADFRTCESFARGLAVAGVKVATACCNKAGDIVSMPWSENLEDAPFSENFSPVFSEVI